MVYVICWLVATACACVAVPCALHWRSRLHAIEDEHELALCSARQRGRNLETAVWEAYGADALPRLRERINLAPWGSRNRTRVYNERGFVGEAWEDGWRVATPEEKAQHEALQDDPAVVKIRAL